MQSFLHQRRRDGSWTQLYCRLRNGSMSFYRGVLDDKPVVTFAVKDYSVISPDQNETVGQSFAFKLTRPGVSQHVLAAEDDKTFQKWMKAFEDQNVQIQLAQKEDLIEERILQMNIGNTKKPDVAEMKLNEIESPPVLNVPHVNGSMEVKQTTSVKEDVVSAPSNSDLLLDFSAESTEGTALNLGRAFVDPTSYATNNLLGNLEDNFHDMNNTLLIHGIEQDQIINLDKTSDTGYNSFNEAQILETMEEPEESFPIHFNQSLLSSDPTAYSDEENVNGYMPQEHFDDFVLRKQSNLTDITEEEDDPDNLRTESTSTTISQRSEEMSSSVDDKVLKTSVNTEQSEDNDVVTKTVKPLDKKLLNLFNTTEDKNQQTFKKTQDATEKNSNDNKNICSFISVPKPNPVKNVTFSMETEDSIPSESFVSVKEDQKKSDVGFDLKTEINNTQLDEENADDFDMTKSVKPLDKNLLSMFNKTGTNEVSSTKKINSDKRDTKYRVIINKTADTKRDSNVKSDKAIKETIILNKASNSKQVVPDKLTSPLPHILVSKCTLDLRNTSPIELEHESNPTADVQDTNLEWHTEIVKPETVNDDLITKNVKPLDKKYLNMFERNASHDQDRANKPNFDKTKETDLVDGVTYKEKKKEVSTKSPEARNAMSKLSSSCDNLQTAGLAEEYRTNSEVDQLSSDAEFSGCKDAMRSAKNVFLRMQSESGPVESRADKVNFTSQRSQEESMSYFSTSIGIRIPLLKRAKSEPYLNEVDVQRKVVACWSGKYAEQSDEKALLRNYSNPFLSKCRLKQKLELERKMAAAEKEAAQRVEDLSKQVRDQQAEKKTEYTIVRVGSYVQALPLRRSDALQRQLAEEERKHTETLRKLQEVRAEVARLKSLLT